MARWIDIPAQRLLIVTLEELLGGTYDLLNADGVPCDQIEQIALVRRCRDRRVFRPARISEHLRRGTFALEEI